MTKCSRFHWVIRSYAWFFRLQSAKLYFCWSATSKSFNFPSKDFLFLIFIYLLSISNSHRLTQYFVICWARLWQIWARLAVATIISLICQLHHYLKHTFLTLLFGSLTFSFHSGAKLVCFCKYLFNFAFRCVCFSIEIVLLSSSWFSFEVRSFGEGIWQISPIVASFLPPIFDYSSELLQVSVNRI